MVIHIALFKWRADASQKGISRAINEIRLLKEKIPEIIDLYCGENFSKWSGGYTYAVIVKTKNRQSLDIYRKHPAHVFVVKIIEKLEEDSLGIDIEV